MVLSEHRRATAGAALLKGGVHHVATAATVSVEGGRAWQRLADRLRRQSEEL